ncbi:unnamed protein product, partial [Meganyctiphanes norvegica]
DLGGQPRLACCPWKADNVTDEVASNEDNDNFHHYGGEHDVVTLNLNQGFLPTVPTVEDSAATDWGNDDFIPLPLQPANSLSRHDLPFATSTESHGINTIGTIRPWPLKWN